MRPRTRPRPDALEKLRVLQQGLLYKLDLEQRAMDVTLGKLVGIEEALRLITPAEKGDE